MVVTPEAVPLDLDTAGLPSRMLARLIDVAIQIALLVVALLAVTQLVDAPGGVGVALVLLVVFLVIVGYPIALEALWRGRTVGKVALGLRVVTVEGAPVRFRHAAIRGVLGLFEVQSTTGAIAVIAILLTARNQRLGDLAAGTVVLRERSGLGAPVPVTFAVPVGLEAFTASLDTATMSTEDYAAVRAFLIRAPTLPPSVCTDLAYRLAHPIASRVRPEPPTGLAAETYLACVAAAYQRRSSPQ